VYALPAGAGTTLNGSVAAFSQSGSSPLLLGAREIVWRAVLPFRARDIERGPWSLLLCAAVICALLRARRIRIVRDGGSRDQHDKGGRADHDDLPRIAQAGAGLVRGITAFAVPALRREARPGGASGWT